MTPKTAKLSVTISEEAPPAFFNSPETLAKKLLACCGLVALSAAKSLKEQDLIIHSAIIGGERVSSWADFEETDKAKTVTITLMRSGTQPTPTKEQSQVFCEAQEPTDVLESTEQEGLKRQLNIINMASNKISPNDISLADRQTAKLCSINLLGTVAEAIQKAYAPGSDELSNSFKKIIVERSKNINQETVNLSGGRI